MKSRNLSLLCLMLSACANTPPKKLATLDANAFDAVSRCVDAQCIESILGKPTEINPNKENPEEVSWIYKDDSQSQRGAVGISLQNQSSTGVLYIPRSNEPESKLSYLLKNKFPNASFERAPLQRCSRDYLPLEVFYIDVKQGLFIESVRDIDVESFAKIQPTKAATLLQKIKTCKR